jgi:hypothetical protein
MQRDNPPAIVKARIDLKTLAAEVKVIYSAISKNEARTLQMCKDAGDILRKMKKGAGHGNWLAVLGFHGIPELTAQHDMRISAHWAICKQHGTKRDALEAIRGLSDEPTNATEPTCDEDQIRNVTDLPNGYAPVGSPERCISGNEEAEEEEAEVAPRRDGGPKLRKPWKEFDSALVKVVGFVDRIVRFIPEEKGTSEHDKAMALLEDLGRVMAQWRKRIPEERL